MQLSRLLSRSYESCCWANFAIDNWHDHGFCQIACWPPPHCAEVHTEMQSAMATDGDHDRSTGKGRKRGEHARGEDQQKNGSSHSHSSRLGTNNRSSYIPWITRLLTEETVCLVPAVYAYMDAFGGDTMTANRFSIAQVLLAGLTPRCFGTFLPVSSYFKFYGSNMNT